MCSSALAGEIYLYTNRRGLYQSLLDLSVFSYVSLMKLLNCARGIKHYTLHHWLYKTSPQHLIVSYFSHAECFCSYRIWMNLWRCVPVLSGQREEMALDNYTCYWRVQDHSRKITRIQTALKKPILTISPPPSLSRHSDMVKVKAVFKRMLAEPHAKVSCFKLKEQLCPAGWI